MNKTKKTYEKPTLEKRSKLSAISANPMVSAPVLKQSDRRLKRNIRALEKSSMGLQLYAFQYLWSDTVFVGVMAQDLLDQPEFSHAVSKMPEGYYQVDYDAIGMKMTTYDQWLSNGLLAVHSSGSETGIFAN